MRVIQRTLLQIAVFHWLTSLDSAFSDGSGVYKAIFDASLCINSSYVESYSFITRDTHCSYMCDQNQRCQAFTTADGPCQLFVFDKCSKSVRDCSCTRRGQVFVKQQPGLQPGALCPSGYGDDLCGVKFKMYNFTGNWSTSRQKCESESGLVIMTDVTENTEMDKIDMLYDKYSIGSFWLGGYQTPGSPEPADGWYWVACNITVDSSLWGPAEPNDSPPDENAIGRWYNHTKLSDFRENSTTPKGALCECLSPFD